MFRKPCLPRFWLYHPDYWIFRNYCAEIHLGDGVVSSLHGPFHINWLSTTRSWAGGCNQKYNAQKNLVQANSEAYTSISMATQNTRKPNYTLHTSCTVSSLYTPADTLCARRNRGATAVVDAIGERQLKWAPLWSSSWSGCNWGEAAVYK